MTDSTIRIGDLIEGTAIAKGGWPEGRNWKFGDQIFGRVSAIASNGDVHITENFTGRPGLVYGKTVRLISRSPSKPRKKSKSRYR